MSKSWTVIAALALGLTLSLGTATAQTAQPNPADPKYQSKGDQDRTYAFPGTTENIAYHIYVPMKWDKNTKLPLVILTHGANQPATAPFMRPMANPTLGSTAEARGFIVAAVTGYHANATGIPTPEAHHWGVPYGMITVASQRGAAGGGAAAGGAGGGGGRGAGGGGGGGRGAGGGGGGGRGGAAAAPPTAEDFARSEQDILNVADIMAKEYNVDTNRIYLMGNSSGGSAVWNLAAKFPERWTAISPSAAPLEDSMFPYEKMKNVPVLVVHGDADTTMVFDGSKAMVDHAKAKGVDATWLPVPGGMHTDAWALQDILNKTFDFYDAHKTKKK
jgi:poly(3-hydroxybutyrate) depolymerase